MSRGKFDTCPPQAGIEPLQINAIQIEPLPAREICYPVASGTFTSLSPQLFPDPCIHSEIAFREGDVPYLVKLRFKFFSGSERNPRCFLKGITVDTRTYCRKGNTLHAVLLREEKAILICRLQ